MIDHLREDPDGPTGQVEVLLAEAHPAVLAVLSAVIRSDPRTHLAGTATNGESAVNHASDDRVTVLDIRLPVLDGLSALTEIRQSRPDAPVIVLLTAESPYLRAEAERRGANAVLTYAQAVDQLVPTIVGQQYLPVAAA